MIGAQTIEVFTTHEKFIALNGENSRVCKLDSLQKIESLLGDRLNASMDEQTVEAVVAEFEPQLNKSVLCQQRAMELVIEKLPAIVIDSLYVAYGVNSVSQALIEYQKEVGDAQ